MTESMFDDLPEKVKEALSKPVPDTPIPDGKSQVDASTLAKDLDYSVGDRVGETALKVEDREDPVEPLRYPLVQYPDRRFFYAGLLHGYCRIDSTVTERYRAQKGVDVSSWIHHTNSPIVTVPAFPEFSGTRLACSLQSIDISIFSDFVGFVCSNNIVDRARGRVWFVDVFDVKIPDPFMVDNGDAPSDAEVSIFCPKTLNGYFSPETSTGFFVDTPKIQFVRRHDRDLEIASKGLLDG